MTIARRLEAVRAISHIFFKSMNWLTEGLADDEHGHTFIVETSFSMSRWFQPSKQSPSTRKIAMKVTAYTVCTWISSTRKFLQQAILEIGGHFKHDPTKRFNQIGRLVFELTPKIGLYFLDAQLLRGSCDLDR